MVNVPAEVVSKRKIVEESCDSTSRNNTSRIQLPRDLLCCVLERLPLIDVIGAKLVSHAWADAVLSSKSHSRFLKSPWLLLPPKRHGEGGYTSYSKWAGSGSCCIMNLEENMVYDLKKSTSDLVSEFACIGSSHGWLIFSDYTTLSPFLFNPFTEARIQLPSLKPLFGISDIEEDDRRIKILWKGKWVILSKVDLRLSFVSRAFLTAEPTGGDYVVVLVSHFEYEGLIYYKNGDISWRPFNDSGFPNSIFLDDIMCYENKLHVLAVDGAIHTWDLETGYPENKIYNRYAASNHTLERPDCFIHGLYLVQSDGEILLVARNVPEEGDHDITTGIFDVYKLDLEGRQWVEVQTLGDNRSLFLGQNQSVSVSTEDFSGCKGNCIYFTHDNHYLSLLEGSEMGMGIYSLKDRKISPIFEFPSESLSEFSRLPCWLIPSSC
ncbi:hypothetical protein SLEP1_g7544 [Rubroshorea leprosula]|uniref:F-box domain-containing protein n=1 Tax=Rubroshorea leprosula TaxID=152421 RepID=A0AAV5I507_9ROSI|nr:hypothetical protein SLEP1_g7544 [Rubroshorea leprosula]